MELFNYLLRVSACTALFFAFYILVLRRLTFFSFNRYYLLFTLLLSFVIPTLRFTIEREVEIAAVGASPVNDFIPLQQQLTQIQPIYERVLSNPIPQHFDWLSLISIGYCLTAASILMLSGWHLFKLLRYVKSSVRTVDGLRLINKSEGFTNCSFFNYVFIDEASLSEAELSVLLKHEEAHSRCYHSIDKLILMLVKGILWFNPVVYFIDKALEQTHEYEADEAASLRFGTQHYANLLLKLAIAKSEMPLVHNFVKSPIKERIKMLFNSKSKNMKKLMYLLVLPIGLGLLWGFTIDVVDVLPSIKNDEKVFTLVLDAGHGGRNKGAEVNGFTEKNITLAMAKKIKVIAESKGIKVLLTRSNDENISIGDRIKVNGDILLSLHVNSAPSNLKNGVEMFISGSYDKGFKILKSTSFTYHLYKSLRNAEGIQINNLPKKQNLMVLNASSMPGVMLELGYLSNKNDFEYMTNNQNQDHFAKLVVEGIIAYQKAQPSDEKMAEFQKKGNDFSIKYQTWKTSEKYKSLVAEAKTVKNQTLIGIIKSLNYFKRGETQDLDGFFLQVKDKNYRVYLTKEQLKKESFKVGDQISIFAPAAEVWFDSDYPVVKPKKVTVLESVGLAPNNTSLKPKLLYSSSAIVDNKNGISYIKNGSMEIWDHKLEAEEITWDRHNETLQAKNFKLTLKDGHTIAEKNITYNLQHDTYVIDNVTRNVRQEYSAAYQLLTKLKSENDSLKMRTIFHQKLIVSGKVKLNVDGYALNCKVLVADKNSNLITGHMATFIDKNGNKISGDIIEFDIISKMYKVTQPVGGAY